MLHLSTDYINTTAQVIWQQIKGTASADVIGSWGVISMSAKEVSVRDEDRETFYMAALMMQVSGFSYQGNLYIALHEGSDYYRIYTESADEELAEYQRDVDFESLASVIDRLVELGNMSQEEYQRRIMQAYCI